jgi:diguanylate cyclase (GGDEF)-like protein/PAS domain S-box-containing protein
MAALGVYTWQQRTAGAKAFGFFAITIFLWTFLAFPEYYSLSLRPRALFGKLQYFGIVFMPLAWLIFTLNYTQRNALLTKRILSALLIIPVLSLLLAFSDNWHGLVWKSVSYTDTPFPSLIIEHGFWFKYVFLPYTYGLFTLGVFVLMNSFLLDSSLYRRQTGLVLVAASMPLVANVLYLLSGLHLYGLDPTPYGFAVCIALCVPTLFRKDPLVITPISYREVFLNTTDSVLLIGKDHSIIDINPRALKDLGLEAKSVLGKPFVNLYPDFQGFLKEDPGEQSSHTLELKSETGEQFVELKLSPLLTSQGKQIGQMIMLRDVTTEYKQKTVLERFAYLDALTGIANRNQLKLESERAFALAKRYGIALSILYVDLDKFKQINDTYGHEIGDEVLIHVANCLRRAMRENDVVARIGGDEFAVLLYEASAAETREAKERLEAILQQPFKVADQLLSIYASIGFALHPKDGETLRDLLRHADAAMYQVKRDKRSSV